jgi:lysylphosphatidylglycerol synthetase-like protein (DUF2156 family)
MELSQTTRSENQKKASLLEGPFFYPPQCVWKKTGKQLFVGSCGELAFEQIGRTRIVAGDPRAVSIEKSVQVFHEFTAKSRSEGYAVCGYYFSEGFATSSGHIAHKCGVSRFENLRRWSLSGSGSEQARRALKKASEAGLTVQQIESHNLSDFAEALQCADHKWQRSKGLFRIKFLLSPLERTLEEVRSGAEVLFCGLSASGDIESLLSVRRYLGNSHWYVDSLMQIPGGDRFALDATLVETMKCLKDNKKAEALALGFCPGIIEEPGGWIERLLGLWRKTRFLYSPEGLYNFKRKYSSLELPRYLLLDPNRNVLRQLSTMEAVTFALRIRLHNHEQI